ncbi:MAG: MucB/RseB C-terminal domain-containing protein [Betaproteobacteria bacterium]|nr:MucB/RseB C-terminal domain-containing protein [Betaproteobacteria bacterium]
MLIALSGALIAPADADQHGDALVWLQKMAVAAQRLNYTGTFTYQSGGTSETSRITHLVDAGGEHEKLEVLDGSPREVLRNDDEVRCFLPEDKLVIVEKRGQLKAFPALLPTSVNSLSDYYLVRKGDVSRVAGFDSQLILLEPKDALRYGHHLWADVNSGLILRARMVNERGEIIEQFAFTQLQINGPIDREMLQSKFGKEGKNWRIHNARASQSLNAGNDWLFKSQLPGFVKRTGMKRKAVRESGTETTHFVFTDGLASISVFIEPLGDQNPEKATYSVGSINVYKRAASKYLLTILGEVPTATLIQLGDGMESRKK